MPTQWEEEYAGDDPQWEAYLERARTGQLMGYELHRLSRGHDPATGKRLSTGHAVRSDWEDVKRNARERRYWGAYSQMRDIEARLRPQVSIPWQSLVQTMSPELAGRLGLTQHLPEGMPPAAPPQVPLPPGVPPTAQMAPPFFPTPSRVQDLFQQAREQIAAIPKRPAEPFRPTTAPMEEWREPWQERREEEGVPPPPRGMELTGLQEILDRLRPEEERERPGRFVPPPIPPGAPPLTGRLSPEPEETLWDLGFDLRRRYEPGFEGRDMEVWRKPWEERGEEAPEIPAPSMRLPPSEQRPEPGLPLTLDPLLERGRQILERFKPTEEPALRPAARPPVMGLAPQPGREELEIARGELPGQIGAAAERLWPGWLEGIKKTIAEPTKELVPGLQRDARELLGSVNAALHGVPEVPELETPRRAWEMTKGFYSAWFTPVFDIFQRVDNAKNAALSVFARKLEKQPVTSMVQMQQAMMGVPPAITPEMHERLLTEMSEGAISREEVEEAVTEGEHIFKMLFMEPAAKEEMRERIRSGEITLEEVVKDYTMLPGGLELLMEVGSSLWWLPLPGAAPFMKAAFAPITVPLKVGWTAAQHTPIVSHLVQWSKMTKVNRAGDDAVNALRKMMREVAGPTEAPFGGAQRARLQVFADDLTKLAEGGAEAIKERFPHLADNEVQSLTRMFEQAGVLGIDPLQMIATSTSKAQVFNRARWMAKLQRASELGISLERDPTLLGEARAMLMDLWLSTSFKYIANNTIDDWSKAAMHGFHPNPVGAGNYIEQATKYGWDLPEFVAQTQLAQLRGARRVSSIGRMGLPLVSRPEHWATGYGASFLEWILGKRDANRLVSKATQSVMLLHDPNAGLLKKVLAGVIDNANVETFFWAGRELNYLFQRGLRSGVFVDAAVEHVGLKRGEWVDEIVTFADELGFSADEVGRLRSYLNSGLVRSVDDAVARANLALGGEEGATVFGLSDHAIAAEGKIGEPLFWVADDLQRLETQGRATAENIGRTFETGRRMVQNVLNAVDDVAKGRTPVSNALDDIMDIRAVQAGRRKVANSYLNTTRVEIEKAYVNGQIADDAYEAAMRLSRQAEVKGEALIQRMMERTNESLQQISSTVDDLAAKLSKGEISLPEYAARYSQEVFEHKWGARAIYPGWDKANDKYIKILQAGAHRMQRATGTYPEPLSAELTMQLARYQRIESRIQETFKRDFLGKIMNQAEQALDELGRWEEGALAKLIPEERVAEAVGAIPAELEPLVAEARKYTDFKDFSYYYSQKIMRGRYWHITDDPRFVIRKDISPRDLSTLASPYQAGEPGLMVTSALEHWTETLEGRQWVAEIDLSRAIRDKDFTIVERGFGHEIMIRNLDAVSVKNVVPLDEAMRESARWDEIIPQSEEALRRFWEQVKGLAPTAEAVAPEVAKVSEKAQDLLNAAVRDGWVKDPDEIIQMARVIEGFGESDLGAMATAIQLGSIDDLRAIAAKQVETSDAYAAYATRVLEALSAPEIAEAARPAISAADRSSLIDRIMTSWQGLLDEAEGVGTEMVDHIMYNYGDKTVAQEGAQRYFIPFVTWQIRNPLYYLQHFQEIPGLLNAVRLIETKTDEMRQERGLSARFRYTMPVTGAIEAMPFSMPEGYYGVDLRPFISIMSQMGIFSPLGEPYQWSEETSIGKLARAGEWLGMSSYPWWTYLLSRYEIGQAPDLAYISPITRALRDWTGIDIGHITESEQYYAALELAGRVTIGEISKLDAMRAINDGYEGRENPLWADAFEVSQDQAKRVDRISMFLPGALKYASPKELAVRERLQELYEQPPTEAIDWKEWPGATTYFFVRTLFEEGGEEERRRALAYEERGQRIEQLNGSLLSAAQDRRVGDKYWREQMDQYWVARGEISAEYDEILGGVKDQDKYHLMGLLQAPIQQAVDGYKGISQSYLDPETGELKEGYDWGDVAAAQEAFRAELVMGTPERSPISLTLFDQALHYWESVAVAKQRAWELLYAKPVWKVIADTKELENRDSLVAEGKRLANSGRYNDAEIVAEIVRVHPNWTKEQVDQAMGIKLSTWDAWARKNDPLADALWSTAWGAYMALPSLNRKEFRSWMEEQYGPQMADIIERVWLPKEREVSGKKWERDKALVPLKTLLAVNDQLGQTRLLAEEGFAREIEEAREETALPEIAGPLESGVPMFVGASPEETAEYDQAQKEMDAWVAGGKQADWTPLMEQWFGRDTPASQFFDYYYGNIPPGGISKEIRDDPIIQWALSRDTREFMNDEGFTEAANRLQQWAAQNPDKIVGNPEEWQTVRDTTNWIWQTIDATPGARDERGEVTREGWQIYWALREEFGWLLDKYYP